MKRAPQKRIRKSKSRPPTSFTGGGGQPGALRPHSDPITLRIIRTASEYFFANGFSTITMDDLAHELGMSKKTLYQHFPTKEDLLTAVLHTKANDIRQSLETITQKPALPFVEKFRAVVTVLTGKLAEIQPVFLYNLQRYAPAHFQAVDELRRKNFTAVFSGLLQEGVDRREVRPDLDIAFAVDLILGAFNKIIDGPTLNRLQLTPGQAIGKALDLIFDGLVVRNT